MAQEIGLTARIKPEVDEGALKKETDKMEKRIKEKSKALQQYRDIERKAPTEDLRSRDKKLRKVESVQKRLGQFRKGAGVLQSLMGTNLKLPMPGISIGGGGFSFGGVGGMSADEPDDIGGLLVAQLSVQEEILQILTKWDGSGVPIQGGAGGGDGDNTFRSRIKNTFKGGGGGGAGGIAAALAIGGGMAMLGALTDIGSTLKNFEWPKINVPSAVQTLTDTLSTFSPTLGGATALIDALKTFDPVPEDWGFDPVPEDWGFDPVPDDWNWSPVPDDWGFDPDPLKIDKPDWIPIPVMKPGEKPTTDQTPGGEGFTVPKEFRYKHYTPEGTTTTDDTTSPSEDGGVSEFDVVSGILAALTGGSMAFAAGRIMSGGSLFGGSAGGMFAAPAFFAAQRTEKAQNTPEGEENWLDKIWPEQSGSTDVGMPMAFVAPGFSQVYSSDGSSSTPTGANTGNRAAESERQTTTVDATVEQHFHIDSGSLQAVKREASREAERSIDELERRVQRELRMVR